MTRVMPYLRPASRARASDDMKPRRATSSRRKTTLPPGKSAVGLIDGVEQGADDDAGERRRRLQHLHRDVDEEIDLAGDQIGSAKAVAGDQGGIARIGEPFGLLAHIAVDAGEGLGDEALELAGDVAGAGRGGMLEDARELRAHGVLGQSQPRRQRFQRCARLEEGGIEDDIGQQRLDHRLAAALEEGLAGIGRIAGRRGLLAADPIDDGANVAVDQGRVGFQPVEGVEGALAACRID